MNWVEVGWNKPPHELTHASENLTHRPNLISISAIPMFSDTAIGRHAQDISLRSGALTSQTSKSSIKAEQLSKGIWLGSPGKLIVVANETLT
ncbi:hypothetical protein O181_057394 [Austropuccinia psidii MF-1]|uniref:Uncharacterized protein n=1 Tax=Austropuccinia psidii MF-1 TaxID=1389203 RepID=A0A9Q3EAD5_9BASI|nr:hypothetical protein [Austropuccinia psidii MF-1]